MKKLIHILPAFALAVLCSAAFAQAPAGAPAGSTGQCKDGTYWTGATKSGACSGHKGVKTWYAATAAKPATPAAAAKPAAAAAAPAPAAKAAPAAKYTPPANAAAGGGPGMVWVNTSTKVYHCPGDRYYGKTKAGSYMTEAAAKAAGYKADANKPCK
jgi:hypothetical protein